MYKMGISRELAMITAFSTLSPISTNPPGIVMPCGVLSLCIKTIPWKISSLLYSLIIPSEARCGVLSS